MTCPAPSTLSLSCSHCGLPNSTDCALPWPTLEDFLITFCHDCVLLAVQGKCVVFGHHMCDSSAPMHLTVTIHLLSLHMPPIYAVDLIEKRSHRPQKARAHFRSSSSAARRPWCCPARSCGVDPESNLSYETLATTTEFLLLILSDISTRHTTTTTASRASLHIDFAADLVVTKATPQLSPVLDATATPSRNRNTKHITSATALGVDIVSSSLTPLKNSSTSLLQRTRSSSQLPEAPAAQHGRFGRPRSVH